MRPWDKDSAIGAFCSQKCVLFYRIFGLGALFTSWGIWGKMSVCSSDDQALLLQAITVCLFVKFFQPFYARRTQNINITMAMDARTFSLLFWWRPLTIQIYTKVNDDQRPSDLVTGISPDRILRGAGVFLISREDWFTYR